MKVSYFGLVIIFLVLTGCEEDKYSYTTPMLSTEEVKVASDSVTFSAEIISLGVDELVNEFGFYVDDDSVSLGSGKVRSQSRAPSGKHKVSLPAHFFYNKEYRARSYIRTFSKTILGNEVRFFGKGGTPPADSGLPTLAVSYSPTTTSSVRTIITLKGQGFGSDITQCSFKIADVYCVPVSMTDSTIVFELPPNNLKGFYSPVITVREKRFNLDRFQVIR